MMISEVWDGTAHVHWTRAGKDLRIGANAVSRWVRKARTHKSQAFPGRGVMKPDNAEGARLKRELANVKAERDILKKRSPPLPRDSRHPGTSASVQRQPALGEDIIRGGCSVSRQENT